MQKKKQGFVKCRMTVGMNKFSPITRLIHDNEEVDSMFAVNVTKYSVL